MLTGNLRLLSRIIFCTKRIHTSTIRFDEYENPIWRTINVLRNNIKQKPDPWDNVNLIGVFPHYVDVLVIGGGPIGSSVAYWLREKTGVKGVTVGVIEKDPTHTKSTTLWSGGLRQQFSLSENVQMSLYGAEFIRTIKKRFGRETDMYFTPNGYLMLADEASCQQLLDNSKLQKELGALNVILSAKELKERYPWMNVEDIEAGCLGIEKEGWIDPWAMLCILKKGAMDANAQYVTGELTDFVFRKRSDISVDGVEEGTYEGVDEAIVKLPNGETKSIKFAVCVLACGADSGEVSRLARIGTGEGLLTVPLPIEKRKRCVYYYGCKNEEPGLNSPMTIDYIGTYFRRDGLSGVYVGGLSPTFEDVPKEGELEANEQHFNEKVLPKLIHRVPCFKNVEMKSAWNGFYDYNPYDDNGIIGPHPYYHNMYIATGFSGHGIQHAPAVGRAISELILDGDYQTIGLSRFGFDRFVLNKPMIEACVV